MVDHLNYTDVRQVEMFEEELRLYEATIKPSSTHPHDFRKPAETVKYALLRIVKASPSDTIGMMRRLATHITANIDDLYSDYVISMMGGATHDEKARQLIMSILYVTRAVIVGEKIDFNEGWLQYVERNMSIWSFLNSYGRSDLNIVEESYSGNVIKSPGKLVSDNSDQDVYTLAIGYSNYDIRFRSNTPQILVLTLSDDVQPGNDADPDKPLVITSEIIITPNVSKIILDKSIGYFDDALAQITAMHCANTNHVYGQDLTINLPGIFYKLLLGVMSSDSGQSWRVTDVSILPPSMTRD